MTDYISRAQAQKLLGCDKDTMVRLLRSGEIETSRKDNGGWLVSYDSLEEYMSKHAKSEIEINDLKNTIVALRRENEALKKILAENGIMTETLNTEPANDSGDLSIADLGLPPRAMNALRSNGIWSIHALVNMSIKDLRKYNNIGRKTALIIEAKLQENGLHLRKC